MDRRRAVLAASTTALLLAVGCDDENGGRGPDGLPGETGSQGPAGPPGPEGPTGPAGAQALFLRQMTRTSTTLGGAEIVAFGQNRAFVTNSGAAQVDIFTLDLNGQITSTTALSLVPGFSPTSVDASATQVAVAAAGPSGQAGRVFLYDAVTLDAPTEIEVGVLPDMLTFTPDGTKILVANEGEPVDGANPEGSVSIIDASTNAVNELDFTDFNLGQSREAEWPNLRTIYTGSTRAEDVEPEYIAVSEDSSTAYVILQEHNGLAIIDLSTPRITSIINLGSKDFELPNNQFDASDLDGRIRLENWPVKGLFQPDAIAAYRAFDGKTYLVTANEGDAGENIDGLGTDEDPRLSELPLDPAVFTSSTTLALDENLGRLRIVRTLGQQNGLYQQLFMFGARSFSVWDGQTGRLVFDSGSDFEAHLAQYYPDGFNIDADEPGIDARSDDKGPEPEALDVGTINGRSYAFIGLERTGGIMVYDITQPQSPQFVTYEVNRNFAATQAMILNGEAGDLAPEGIRFVSEIESPTGTPLLLVANETSQNLTIYAIETRL